MNFNNTTANIKGTYVAFATLLVLILAFTWSYKHHMAITPRGTLTERPPVSKVVQEPQAVSSAVEEKKAIAQTPQVVQPVQDVAAKVEAKPRRKTRSLLRSRSSSFDDKEEQWLSKTITTIRICAPSGATLEKEFPSNLTFRAVKDQLLQEAGMENLREEFGLCMIDGKITEWMDEMQIISDSSDELKASMLYLKAKPKPLLIQYVSDTPRTLYP
jgi:hypothetical protein